MPNGLTPYDKKVYRESKRRRKQAFLAAETGRIKPIKKRRKWIVITVISVVALIALAVGLFFVMQNISSDEANKNITQTESDESQLILVNRTNTLKSDYVPKLKNYGSFMVNESSYNSLDLMINDAQRQGINLVIIRAYVSFDEQADLYEQKFSEYMNNPDYTEVRAEAETRKTVAKAGESEFQTGLLISFDVSDSVSSAYLERNCVKYGFIQRYTDDKEDITGISADKSTYRFVGNDNAVNMRSYNMCLEEYCNYLEIQQENE